MEHKSNKNECSITTHNNVNDYYQHDEWKNAITVVYILYKKNPKTNLSKLIWGECDWRGHKGGFWSAGKLCSSSGCRLHGCISCVKNSLNLIPITASCIIFQ